MKQLCWMQVTVPPDVSFNDLHLSLSSDGYVHFDLDVLRRVCEASNLSLDAVMALQEKVLGSILCGWYAAHIQRGGEPDPVAEYLNAEMRAEAAAGQQWSFPAGRA